MDSLLIVGEGDPQLQKFLSKMGFKVSQAKTADLVREVAQSQFVDLIILESTFELDPVEICTFLRSEKKTEEVPIVFLARDNLVAGRVRSEAFDKVECIEAPFKIGSVASKIATQLRLRKMKGADNETASLAEMNAALRDLTERRDRELDEGRKIQETLLPKKLPEHKGFQLSVLYKPLDELGGDWYYAQTEQSGKISLHIADVTGHGLAASLICSMARLAMVASANEDPGEMLSGMNSLMTPQMAEGRFITMFSCSIDPENGSLEYARAGHPPALLYKTKENQVVELKSEGFPIGFMDEGIYHTASDIMGSGDVLVLYTDGIQEASNRSAEMYGIERIGEVVKSVAAERNATGILEALLIDLKKFTDGRIIKDDITIIVLKKV